MTKNFVFNMGYDTSHVTSVLASEGLEANSSIILVTPPDHDSRQENAIDDISNFLGSLDYQTSLEVFPAGKSVKEDIKEFCDIFSRTENLILSLSGGPRDTLISLTIAATLSENDLEKIFFRSDIDSNLQELAIPQINFDLEEADQKMLKNFTEEKKVSEVVENVEFSESTVYRYLNSLKKQRLIEESKDGEYRTTSIGEILIN